MREPRVSVLIVARNEAHNLPRCFASLGWADELIVAVDPSSRDATEAMARRRANRVLVRPFDDFASQRNAALRLATGDWVFSIDADERVPPELAAEIRSTLANPSGDYAGYRVPIRSVILGRLFHYSGTQDDKPLRLFRRRAGRWVGEVHETVDLRGQVGTLSQSLRHRTLDDMRIFLRKIDRYTTLEALRLHREGHRPRRGDLWLRPLWTFAKLYLAKFGYRDGAEGFAFCALSGVSVGIRQWKLRELTKNATVAIPAPRALHPVSRMRSTEPAPGTTLGTRSDSPRTQSPASPISAPHLRPAQDRANRRGQ